MNKRFYLIPTIVALFCVITAVVARNSYTNIGNGVYQYRINGGGDCSTVLQHEKIHSAEDLIDRSELIVRAKFDSQRLIRDNGFYTTVHISRVLKGDKGLENKDIIVTEAVVIFTNTKFINEALTPLWIPLQQNNEYLLLLKKISFDPHRVLNDFQKMQYYPVTQSAFGCYRLSGKNQTETMNNKESYTVNSLKGFEIFAYDRKTLDAYHQYKAQILSRFSIR